MASKETGGTGQYGHKQEGEPQEREDNSIKGRHPSSIFFPLLLLCIFLLRWSSRANGSLACLPNRKGFNIRRFGGSCYHDGNNLYLSKQPTTQCAEKVRGDLPKVPASSKTQPIYFPTTTEAIAASLHTSRRERKREREREREREGR